jgi:anthranilate phosphoribosyltransferase
VELFGEVSPAEELRGGDAETNARITTEILGGTDGPRRRIVVLNAALAIVAGDKAGRSARGSRGRGLHRQRSRPEEASGLIERSHS